MSLTIVDDEKIGLLILKSWNNSKIYLISQFSQLCIKQDVNDDLDSCVLNLQIVKKDRDKFGNNTLSVLIFACTYCR